MFTTDAVLSLLLAAPRSLNSWDIVVNRQGNQVFLDARDYDIFSCVHWLLFFCFVCVLWWVLFFVCETRASWRSTFLWMMNQALL